MTSQAQRCSGWECNFPGKWKREECGTSGVHLQVYARQVAETAFRPGAWRRRRLPRGTSTRFSRVAGKFRRVPTVSTTMSATWMRRSTSSRPCARTRRRRDQSSGRPFQLRFDWNEVSFQTRNVDPSDANVRVRFVPSRFTKPPRARSSLQWRRSWDLRSSAKGWSTPSTVRAPPAALRRCLASGDGAADVAMALDDSVSCASRARSGSAVPRRERQGRADRAHLPARQGGPRTRGRNGGAGERHAVGTLRGLGQVRVRRTRTTRMLGRLRGSMLWSAHGASRTCPSRVWRSGCAHHVVGIRHHQLRMLQNRAASALGKRGVSSHALRSNRPPNAPRSHPRSARDLASLKAGHAGSQGGRVGLDDGLVDDDLETCERNDGT